MALSAPYVVTPYLGQPHTKVTKYHNVYWFDPETMEPLINSPGHVRALETLIALSKAGSAAMWGRRLGGAWAAFVRGRSVLVFACGEIGSRSEAATEPRSA